MHILAVIPAYNEAATIADLALRAGRYVEQVIVVDDGSRDGTAAAVHDIPTLCVLCNATNRGKAASLWRGMQQALEEGASAVITLDGDGQHRPEDIPALITAARRHPDQIIIGARLRGRDSIPWLRRCAHRLANFWISMIAGYRIADTQSGFRLYPAALLRQLDLPHDRNHSFVWESEVLIEAARLGFGSLPVEIDAVYHPAARASHFRAVKDIFRIARMLVWRSINRILSRSGFARVVESLPRKH